MQAEQFWTNIAELWFSCYEVFFRLSLPDVIFGIIDCEQSESFKVLNYLILHGFYMRFVRKIVEELRNQKHPETAFFCGKSTSEETSIFAWVKEHDFVSNYFIQRRI